MLAAVLPLPAGWAVNGDEFISRMDAAVQEVTQKEEVRYWMTIHDEIEMWKNAADAAKAEADAAVRLTRLTETLLKLGRMKDAARAFEDEEYRKVLLDELNL